MSEQSNNRQLIIDVVASPLTEAQAAPARPVGSGDAHTVRREQAEDSPDAGPECTSLGGSPRASYSETPPRTFLPETFVFVYQSNGRITGAFHASARTTFIAVLILFAAIAALAHTNLVDILATVLKAVAK